MEATELIEIISRLEDGRHQFKVNVTNEVSLAAEMVAFSNSGGGMILIGVADNGEIKGLSGQDVHRINQLISNAACNHVKPPINPVTENVALSEGLIIVIHIRDGISKPYMDHTGSAWVKSGADKRKVTSREELQRMYQTSGLVHADITPVNGTSEDDIDKNTFYNFMEKHFGESPNTIDIELLNLLRNMNLATKQGELNISGLLIFGKRPLFKAPSFIVKAIVYPGTQVDVSHYQESADITGRLDEQYAGAMAFIKRNLKRLQNNQSINSEGEPEIPEIVFEELIANALIHRDYFIQAPVRIFIYSDRIEIVSPGHLPNTLTVSNIKAGNSNIRNPVLASYATKMVPYRGLGSGIVRALRSYPAIDFVDDRDGNLFKAIIQRN